MTPELEQTLYDKYPAIFELRNGSKPIEPISFGIECGDGWYNIILALCESIDGELQHNERSIRYAEKHGKTPPERIGPIHIEQVKEKFGELRFYVYQTTPDIEGMVRMAERMSIKTCEVCGCPGKLRSGGWVRTLCDKHHGEINAESKTSS